jgi:glucokinase
MSESAVILGMDFGGTKIAAAVCDLDGIRLGATTTASAADGGAQASLERGIAAAQALLADVAPGRPLVALGACTFGIPGEDRIDLAPNIAGWSDLALGHELRRAFGGVEIRLATDVKAAAQAEAEWGALAGCDPGIYLNLGTGLAVAIVANGAVLHGRHGAAGEIGYNLRNLSDVGVALEDRLPLEEFVSGKALAQHAVRLGGSSGDVEGLFGFASADPEAAKVLADFLDELAFHLVNLTIAIDPVRIVVGGGMVRSWQQLQPRLRAALDAAVPFPPELVVADFPFDAPLMGALALGSAAARASSIQGAPA